MGFAHVGRADADAGEQLALCDPRGHPLAHGARRDIVHREGIWHRSFHCWIVRRGAAGVELLLQQRAPSKATWPGAWDVSAAGHYQVGEGIEGGCREIREELGLAVAPDEPRWLGRHRDVLRYASGLRDNEYQDVYLLARDLPLAAFAPDHGEVSGLAWVRADVLVRVAQGRLPRATLAARLAVGADWRERPATLVRHRLVPHTGRYYARVARAASGLVQGRGVGGRRD